MALVSGGFELHVQLVDSSGVDVSKLVYQLTAADADEGATQSATILGLLNTVTDAAIKGYSLLERFVENALVLPAAVEVENRAVITARIFGEPGKSATIVIPAPSIGIFQSPTGSGRNIVDTADADLLAYLGIWQETGGIATISDGEELANASVIVAGKRTHRKSSNG